MKLPHFPARLAVAAGLLGGAGGLAMATGVAPASVLQLASSDDDPGDISGPCDEIEHADDPECNGVVVPGSTATTSPTTSPTTAPPTTGIPGSRRAIDAAGAGSVIYAVNGGSLVLIAATPASGWQVEIEQAAGREIEVDFRSGTRRVQVNVEFEDGVPRERVRFRDDADDTRVETENGVVVRQEPGDDGSSSGPGSGGDDVDDNSNSGPGSGSDDDGGDDNSGSGHGGDDSGGDDSSGSGSGPGHGGDD